MTHYSYSSQAGQNGSSQKQPYHEEMQHYSTNNHDFHQLKSGEVAQETAYSHQHSPAISSYPQRLEFDVHTPDTSSTQYNTHSYAAHYGKAPRCWSHVNPAIQAAIDASPLDCNHSNRYVYIPSARHAGTYQTHSNATYANKQRLTHAELKNLDSITSLTSSIVRLEDGDPRAGPWDGIGGVPQRSIREKRKR